MFPGAVCAQSPYRPVRIPSCPLADSLLGPKGGDGRGDLRGFYSETEDVGRLVAGGPFSPLSRSGLQADVTFFGRGPYPSPDPTVTIFLRAPEAFPYLDGARASPAHVRLDDSITLGPYPVTIGSYVGPRDHVVLPLSIHLAHGDFLRTVQARRIAIVVDDRVRQLDDGARRSLRALYRTSVCQSLK